MSITLSLLCYQLKDNYTEDFFPELILIKTDWRSLCKFLAGLAHPSLCDLVSV